MEHTSDDLNKIGSVERPPCIGLTPDVLPEVLEPAVAENSQTGVSTRNVPSADRHYAEGEPSAASAKVTERVERKDLLPPIIRRRPRKDAHWYALRATYGREKKAYDYLVKNHVEAYYPTIETVRVIGGKRKTIVESRLPNIFFARGTEDEIKAFVYDNGNLPYLRFYYCHSYADGKLSKEPLIVPDCQMESLRIICAAEAADTIFLTSDVEKFRIGQMVRVVGGNFQGVVGRVARFQGQQRVGIVIDGLLTACTAYIPTAFLEEMVECSRRKAEKSIR